MVQTNWLIANLVNRGFQLTLDHTTKCNILTITLKVSFKPTQVAKGENIHQWIRSIEALKDELLMTK